ncbi:ABC transporter substrate-binding protein [Paenibacillus sp. 1001270B_150601_E10]|uniref:ABC transporter substrate-binding protein n=1 Tax=Paenibacillus sp. 1001270B_150601_E10 TaxID=2787079 RepID=UPI00189DE512|nr:extracellular solute-binding protein [Paenibacillus sp. 1001270B_150601_E10]
MVRKRVILFLLSLMLLFIVSACSSGGTPEAQPAPTQESQTKEEAKPEEQAPAKTFSNEPAELLVATPWGEEYFNTRIGDYMREKLPHIQVTHVDWNGTVEKMQELNASQTVPDIVLAYTGQAPLEELEMVYPLDDMIKEYGIDLSTVDPAIVAQVQSRDKEGRLIGIPQEMGVIGLHYNKEIFDLFGVEYPSDDMTWDEAIELAKQLTAERNGIKYRGLELGSYSFPLKQLSVTYTDPDTGEVQLTKKAEFVQYMELMKKLYSIPGMYDENMSGFSEKTVAMHIDWHGYLTWFGGNDEEAKEFQQEMDIVPVPTFPGKELTAPTPNTQIFTINAFSEHKEAAFQWILESISPEYQSILAKAGTPSVLTGDKTINEQFAQDNIRYEGKNIAAFFQYPFTPPPAKSSPWDSYVKLDDGMKEFLQSDMDIQVFLRKLEEESQKAIQEAKSASGQ